ATEFGEDGRGLLMVSGEVTKWCLRGAWSLAPTVVIRVAWLSGHGHHLRGGDGAIPAHPLGDHDMQPTQQRRSDRCSGLAVGELVVVAGRQIPVASEHHRIMLKGTPCRAPGGQPQPGSATPRSEERRVGEVGDVW